MEDVGFHYLKEIPFLKNLKSYLATTQETQAVKASYRSWIMSFPPLNPNKLIF